MQACGGFVFPKFDFKDEIREQGLPNPEKAESTGVGGCTTWRG